MFARDHGLRVMKRQIGAYLSDGFVRERRQRGEATERLFVARLRPMQQRLRLLLQLFEIRSGG